MFSSVQRLAASWSSSTLRGRMKYRAGPPILYQVYGASGTYSAATSSKPAKGEVVAMRIMVCLGAVRGVLCGRDDKVTSRPYGFPRSTGQFSGDLPNVASAHGHHHVAGL